MPSRTGIVFLATENRTSTTAALRRMTEDPEPPDHVFLVSDERQPLALGDKGQEYLDSLRSRGRERFQDIELSLREYAELDALEGVIGNARSGDIEGDRPGGQTFRISEEDAVRSHRRQEPISKAPPVGHAHRGG